MKHIARIFLLLLCTTITLQAQLVKKDVIDFRSIDQQACCFDIHLENAHVPDSPLNHLELRILTSGVFFEPGVGGPWPTKTETDSLVIFGEQGLVMQPGEVYEGFNVCFRFEGVQSRIFRVEWRTHYNGRIATIDTAELDCTVQIPVCDSVDIAVITIPTQPDGSCCYELTLKNRHEPAGDLDGFKLVVLTSGAAIVGTSSGPWAVTEQTPLSVTYETTNSPLGSGATLKGFRVCVAAPQGNPGSIIMHWYSLSNGQTVCEGDVLADCIPQYSPRGDTLLLKKQQDCSYEIGFINKHVPASTLSAFRLGVITAGASISSVTAPNGWTISSQTALNAQFSKSGAPVAIKDSAKGFLVTFKPSSSGLVRFAWTTLNGNTVVTRDTVQVQCDPPPPVTCDSLLVTPLAESCSYDFGFVNRHQPASETNDFHIRLQNPGATIDSAIAPAGWIIESRTLTDIVFKDTMGVIGIGEQQTGFVLTLTPGSVGDIIVYEWCTSLNGSIHCCEFASVNCAREQERCDSLAVAPSQDYCSYEFSLSNLRIPNTGLDAFTIRLDNPAAVLLAAEAPSGWTLDTLDDLELRFAKISGALMTGETANGFVVHFVPSATSSQIPFTWCTELAGQTRCCDTMSVACEVKLIQCDVIDVVTSTENPCCFEFNVQNVHLPRGSINGLIAQIITPGVTLFNSTITDPDGWTNISSSTRIGWRSLTTSIASGATLGSFKVCYDNSAINNADFQIAIQTVEDGRLLCEDTITIKCDRTLSIQLIPGSRPDRYRLHQNYPNPFNPSTTIVFDIPQRADITLSLYDAHGRLVMDLGSGAYEAGSWSITLDASALPSGTYHYQLRSAQYTATCSMVLLK